MRGSKRARHLARATIELLRVEEGLEEALKGLAPHPLPEGVSQSLLTAKKNVGETLEVLIREIAREV